MRHAICLVSTFVMLILPAASRAETIRVKDGVASIDLSASQMSRVVVVGHCITAVRSLDDPAAPQLLAQTDEASGDVFIGFDGDAVGRTFSAFLSTDKGETIQLLLHPGDGPARTVEIQGEVRVGSPEAAPLRSSGYSETVTAFMKLMFNGQVVEGVRQEPSDDRGRTAKSLLIRVLTTYRADGLKGTILVIVNKDTVPRPVTAETFLVAHVIAAGVSNELLQPGEAARAYIVEEAQ